MLQSNYMDALAGETYARQFIFTRTGLNNSSEFVGDVGWGAEFGIYDPDDQTVLLAVATIGNNKAAFVAPGILWISFQQTETIGWAWKRGSWYLDLIAPNLSLDPNGYRETVLRGSMMCEPRAPRRFEAFQTNFR